MTPSRGTSHNGKRGRPALKRAVSNSYEGGPGSENQDDPIQPAPTPKPRPDAAESVSAIGVRVGLRLHQGIDQILQDRKLSVEEKRMIGTKMCDLVVDILEELHAQNNAHISEQVKSNYEKQSLRDTISTLQKQIESVQNYNELKLKHELTCQIDDYFQRATERVGKNPFQANNISVDALKHCKKRTRTKQANSDSPVPTMELQNAISHGDESSEKLKTKKANGDLNQITIDLNLMHASYTDGPASRTLLVRDTSATRTAVTVFQTLFSKCVGARTDVDFLNGSDVFFARPAHSSQLFKSRVNRVFFEGFENESFNTMHGVSTFPVPNHRRDMFYEYYLREQKSESHGIDDPQFEEFCEMKAHTFLERYFPKIHSPVHRFKLSLVEQLGGPDLVSAFEWAAKCVWLLHKLAFSFEPPANIFRVEEGADVDPNYMEHTIVKLDDDDRFVSKVGFVIDPGLRLNGEIIVRCDVYLAAREAASSPKV